MVMYMEKLGSAYYGKRNLTKGTVLKYLFNVKYSGDPKELVTMEDISKHTGLSLKYIQHRMNRWAKWNYVLVDYVPGMVKTLFYRIATKGEQFLADAPEPVLAKYQASIDAAEAKLYKDDGGIKGLFS